MLGTDHDLEMVLQTTKRLAQAIALAIVSMREKGDRFSSEPALVLLSQPVAIFLLKVRDSVEDVFLKLH